ncbi:hypothetical protein [Calothrix sp. 336/3]|uniref:hypothetical protein n=1 Tax=Calothrix sp. 336/3 TaxID=1337936 RepID=UPI0004E43ACD|nr:hypothetical protein [Calothrix sp. 336/3]AKG21497.1 hypothetical protein IJ00_09570 [Calothrix sp. 336/3]
MKFDISTLTSFGSLLIAASTTFAGALLWYVNSEKKKYAAERDFAHLKRNQEQIQQGIVQILDELDGRFDRVERDVLEIKAKMHLPIHKDEK